MKAIHAFVLGLLPSLVTGAIGFYIQRAQKRRDKDMEEKAEARRREYLLMMELEMATAKLSYAVACAIKRGTPNGEVEDGIEAYEAASEKYATFLKEQAIEHLHV